MAHADLERAMAVQKELQEIFRKRVGGWRDEETLERVRRLGTQTPQAGWRTLDWRRVPAAPDRDGDPFIGQPVGAIAAGSRLMRGARVERTSGKS
jgi:hypothetical protein